MARPVRKILSLTLALSLTWAAAAQSGASAQVHGAEPPFVAVTIATNSADIRAIIDGMRDQLAAHGRWPGDTVRIEVADTGTDSSRAVRQVRAFVRDGADVLVAINGPSIEAAVAANHRIPLVVAGVSQEMAEGCKRKHSRSNFTGIVSGATHSEQLVLIRKLFPDVETVAVPIDPGDGKIKARLQAITAVARRHDMEIRALAVSVAQNTVSNQISELTPTRSAILLDRGLMPAAPVEVLAKVAEQRNLPLFATDKDSVIRGALAALVIEPFGIGVQLGDLVARILEEPSAIRGPFKRARAAHLILNPDARPSIDVTAVERDMAPMRRSMVDWADIAGPRPRIRPSAPAPPPLLGIARGIKVPIPRAKPPPPSG